MSQQFQQRTSTVARVTEKPKIAVPLSQFTPELSYESPYTIQSLRTPTSLKISVPIRTAEIQLAQPAKTLAPKLAGGIPDVSEKRTGLAVSFAPRVSIPERIVPRIARRPARAITPIPALSNSNPVEYLKTLDEKEKQLQQELNSISPENVVLRSVAETRLMEHRTAASEAKRLVTTNEDALKKENEDRTKNVNDLQALKELEQNNMQLIGTLNTKLAQLQTQRNSATVDREIQSLESQISDVTASRDTVLQMDAYHKTALARLENAISTNVTKILEFESTRDSVIRDAYEKSVASSRAAGLNALQELINTTTDNKQKRSIRNAIEILQSVNEFISLATVQKIIAVLERVEREAEIRISELSDRADTAKADSNAVVAILQRTVQDNANKISALETSVREKEERIRTLETARASPTEIERVNNLEKTIQDRDARIATLERTVTENQQTDTSLRQQLDEQRRLVTVKTNELARFQEDVARENLTASDLIKQQQSRLIAERDQLRSQLTELENTNTALNTTLAARAADIENLKNEKDNAQRQFRESNARISNQTRAESNLQSTVDALKNELTNLKNTNSNLNEQIILLRNNNASIDNELKEAKRIATGKPELERQIEDLKNQHREDVRKLRQSETSLTTLRTQLENAATAKSVADAKMIEQSNKIAELTNQIATGQRTLEQVRADLRKSQTDLDAAREDFRIAETTITTLQENELALKQQLKESQDLQLEQKLKLEQALQTEVDLKTQVITLQQSLDVAQATVTHLQEDIAKRDEIIKGLVQYRSYADAYIKKFRTSAELALLEITRKFYSVSFAAENIKKATTLENAKRIAQGVVAMAENSRLATLETHNIVKNINVSLDIESGEYIEWDKTSGKANLLGNSNPSKKKKAAKIDKGDTLLREWDESQTKLKESQTKPKVLMEFTKKRHCETIENSSKSCKTMEKEFSLSDVDFSSLNNKAMIEQVTCGICFCVTMDPHMLSQCQHTYCKNCIITYCGTSSPKKVDHSCPSCRTLFTLDNNIKKNMLQANIVEKLLVHCIFSKCTWQGEYGIIYHHIKNDCEHLTLCDCNKIILKTEATEHTDTCESVKIKCACGKRIERGKLKDHEQEKCPNTLINCEYESHGCLWQGKRSEYWTDHESDCKVRKLYKEFCLVKKNTTEVTDPMIKYYRKSDCFAITGLNGENTMRRQLLFKYVRSNYDLKFPIKLGSTSDNIICMTGVITSGIFDIDTKKTSNNCMIDIDLKEAVMAITFAGKKDRFFIIAIKGGKPSVAKGKGGRINIIFVTPKNKLMPSPIVYAHREWVNFQDDEYPFTIEPSSRMISQFNLHHEGGRVENDNLYAKLVEFFNLEAWNEFE